MRNYNYSHILLFVTLSVSIVFLASCSNTPSDSGITTNYSIPSYNRLSPEDTVKGFIKCIKISDFDQVSSYMNNGDSYFKYDTEEEEKMIKLIFSKIDYEIISSDVKNASAAVKTKITAPDLDKISDQVADDMINKLEEIALEESNEDTVQFTKMMTESLMAYLSKPKLPFKTTTVNIDLIKDENTDKWVVKLNEDLFNALTGDTGLTEGLLEDMGEDTKTEKYTTDDSNENKKAVETENQNNNENKVDLQEPDIDINNKESNKTESSNNNETVVEKWNKTIIIENKSITIDNDSTSYETTKMDEELKKELEDVFNKLEDMNN